MPRRVSLPGASELFRSTGTADPPTPSSPASPAPQGAAPVGGTGEPNQVAAIEEEPGRGSGRVRHDEKITVYVSADELVALEQARLTLRARYRRPVDRGRIVREAVAAALADLEANGEDSELIRRLTP